MEITLTHILIVLIACFFAGMLGYQHGVAP